VAARAWVFPPSDRHLAGVMARAVGISPVTAQVLVNRGVRDPAVARKFLQPQLGDLIDPMRFSGMVPAVDRLHRALRENEQIAIFGDYDVDGTTGTALLARYLRLVGRDPIIRIPHRMTEGYGLSVAAVEDFALAGAKVLVTIDCGTNDHEEIELARARGIDVIVVDHHETPTRESGALALINPKADANYPFKGISSVGIAFKLAQVLANKLERSSRLNESYARFIVDAMAYVALGTVADVSPLTDENRVLVAFGLKALESCTCPGLRALVDKVGLSGKRIDTFDISFKLAPRLNALGRLGSAQQTVDLFLTEDPARIAELMKQLESANRARKDIEEAIFEQAVEQVERRPELHRDPVIVVADERWHVGVVGIVAARLVDRYARPAFVLAIDGDMAKGSGRSIEGFGLHEAIEAARDLIVSGGGHARAAGAGVKRDKLEEFRIRINEHAVKAGCGELPEPALAVDEEVRLGDVTKGLVKELQRLEPHGEGNRPPRFVASHLRVAGQPRLMGKKNDHLSFHVAEPDGPGIRAVGFGRADWFDALGSAHTVSLAFRPVLNEWLGRESVELHVDDMKFV